MVNTKHKTIMEVMTMADALIKDRGKYISQNVLTRWQQGLQNNEMN
jgi:hypothetical protein